MIQLVFLWVSVLTLAGLGLYGCWFHMQGERLERPIREWDEFTDALRGGR